MEYSEEKIICAKIPIDKGADADLIFMPKCDAYNFEIYKSDSLLYINNFFFRLSEEYDIAFMHVNNSLYLRKEIILLALKKLELAVPLLKIIQANCLLNGNRIYLDKLLEAGFTADINLNCTFIYDILHLEFDMDKLKNE